MDGLNVHMVTNQIAREICNNICKGHFPLKPDHRPLHCCNGTFATSYIIKTMKTLHLKIVITKKDKEKKLSQERKEPKSQCE